jgi:soluble lytic murein transglycosylase
MQPEVFTTGILNKIYKFLSHSHRVLALGLVITVSTHLIIPPRLQGDETAEIPKSPYGTEFGDPSGVPPTAPIGTGDVQYEIQIHAPEEKPLIAPPSAAKPSTHPASTAGTDLKRELRLSHARELLGKYYANSIVQKTGEHVKSLDPLVLRWTQEGLGKTWKKSAKAVSKTIVEQSLKYEFDPIFILSVIQSESGFNPHAKGTQGEIGLMQLMPDTAKWIAKKNKIKWTGKNCLRDPITNIKLGAAYLSSLRDEFDSHARLYLAAYNMGATNVNNALDNEIWPKDYPARVMKHYFHFYQLLKDDTESRKIASSSPVKVSKSKSKKTQHSKAKSKSAHPKMAKAAKKSTKHKTHKKQA